MLPITAPGNSLSYMRQIAPNAVIVGSGDFAVKDASHPPAPLASVALYSAAMFRKLFPDTPFDVQRVWGGVFARSPDDLPVTGELADGWYVVGGAGGGGVSLIPALTEQTVGKILGRDTMPLTPVSLFGPRRFFLAELRHDLTRELQAVQQNVAIEHVRVVMSESTELGPPAPPRWQGDNLVLQVEEATLDAMNPDLASILGEPSIEVMRRREQVKADWIAAQMQHLPNAPKASAAAPRPMLRFDAA